MENQTLTRYVYNAFIRPHLVNPVETKQADGSYLITGQAGLTTLDDPRGFDRTFTVWGQPDS